MSEARAAYFSGGCFWCTESCFEKYRGDAGIFEAVSGFANGTAADGSAPTYRQVASGLTDFREAVKVLYDPSRISYKNLLYIFWRGIDPTDGGGQFADRGFHYTTAVFYSDETERKIAEETKAELARSSVFMRFMGGRTVATVLEPFANFYPAEDYHQDYHALHAADYQCYLQGSGRAAFITAAWGDDACGRGPFPA